MISYRRLQPNQFEKWIEHCAYVFSSTNNADIESFREYFRRHFLNDPWRDMSSIFVAMDGDEIIGTVRLFKRKINLDEQVVTMGGIGEVSVNPNYQNMRIASNLLNLAYEKMVEEKINISFLFASRYSFYNRHGYISAKGIFYKTEVKNVTSSVKIKKATELDLKVIGDIYESYTKYINGTIVRNNNYWNNWVLDEVKDLYLVLDKEEQPIAYIAGYVKDDTVIIKEYGEIKSLNLFNEIASYFATNFFENIKYISYPSMYNVPTSYVDKEESHHLMVKLISTVNDITTTEELVNHLAKTRSGFYETDSF
jgi:predicted N-acetyltransferase YhbS